MITIRPASNAMIVRAMSGLRCLQGNGHVARR